MPRRARRVPQVGLLHVYIRGNNKRKIFLHLRHYRIFYAILCKVKTEENIKIHHYVLMPNHMHILVGVNKDSDLGKFMMRLMLKYSNYFKKKYSYVGQLWQGRYKSRLIQYEKYLAHCGKYIELNPVRAKIVQRPEDYIFSSYNYYACGKKDKLVDMDPLYTDFSDDEQNKQKAYKQLDVDPSVSEHLDCSNNDSDNDEEKKF